MPHSLSRQFDRVLFRAMRTFPFTRDKLVVVRDGPLKGYRMSVRVDNTCLFGYYEQDAIQSLCQLIGPEDVVFDLGANAGYYSMIMARRTANQVHSFEPMPEYQKLLARHLSVNRVPNVIQHNVAVSNLSGHRQFTNVSGSLGNSYLEGSYEFQHTHGTIDVECVSLDDMVFLRGISPPHVIKIDVEGAELDVLQGGERVLREHRPSLLLGTHEVHVPGIRQKCCDFLRARGYSITPTAENKSEYGLDDFICIYEGSSTN
jgi:FkbM family methyltransferase